MFLLGSREIYFKKKSQTVFTCSKSSIVKIAEYFQILTIKNDIIDVVLLFLLMTVNIFFAFFCCFHCYFEQVNARWDGCSSLRGLLSSSFKMLSLYRNQPTDLQSRSIGWFLYDENIG